MSDKLWLDFETSSAIEIETNGLDRYVKDHSTKVLMLGYALGDDPVQLWEPHKSSFPYELAEMLEDPLVTKCAYNAGFERNVFRSVLHNNIPIHEWFDVMIQARHLSIPGSLDQVCGVLGLPESEAKIADGKRLINMFSYPVYEARDTLFGCEQARFRDWETDPADWELFRAYCIRDVEAERAIHKKMAEFPLPAIEQQGWILDQKINDRGVPVDLTLVRNALHIADQAKYALDLRMKKITGLDNPQSVQQLLAWAVKQGYPFHSMGKVWVQRALDGKDITDDCREVFKLRQQASKTSWSKFEAIQNIVSSDGCARNQFSYLGSARAGRWAGRDIQWQNLPRPTPQVEKKMDLAVELVRAGKYDQIKRQFPNEMDVVSSVIRPAFRAPDGYEFDIADLNAIENRAVGWETDCQPILDVFRNGLDPYKDFGTRLFKKPYSEITKDERQTSKPAVLGAAYRLSGGEEGVDKFGNPIKTGLWGYAASMGIHITQEQSIESVKIFRDNFKEVTRAWYNLEDAAIATVYDGSPREICRVVFQLCNGVMRVVLPSGRSLHYINPKVENREFFGKMKATLTYDGQQQETKQWGTIPTHGGKLLENITQAIARDILLHGMQLAEKMGIWIVAHVHDELISLRKDKSRLNDLINCMSVVPDWAPGLILGADGFSSQYYKKA